MAGKNVHTVPNGDDGWSVKREEAERASRNFETKVEAEAYGRKLAMNDGVEHFVHKLDGTIGNRNSYGNDPHPPKG